MVQPTEEEIESILRVFSVADYVLLALLLMVCVGIGTYYGFFRGKVTTEDYLIGGRKMKLVPTSLSLIATLISGTTMLGAPADTYLNGSPFVYSSFAYMLAAFIMPWAFLPVLHQLRLTTIYQYLELRFNKSVRLLVSVLFVIKMFIAVPRFIYPPAIVFNQVTGESLHYGSALLTIVCIFYTCVGGFKAVVWTDVVQCIFMYGSLLLVIIKGTIDIGGPAVVFERSNAGGRLEAPNFDLNPTVHYTFWSLAIGMCFNVLNQNTFYQGMVQRYISIPELGTAKKAAFITNFVGAVIFTIICSYFGLLIYAEFHDCDPISTKVAKGKDQVVPLYVMKTLGQYPGLPGIFVAGIFSAALSTVSSVLNALSAVALEDFYKTFIKRPISQRESNILMKTVVIVFGIAGGALVYVIEKIGTILQVTFTVGSMTDGPAFGVFLMGFLLPCVNTQGVLAGAISGLAFSLWIVLGSEVAVASGHARYVQKPMSVKGCPGDFGLLNSTLVTLSAPDSRLNIELKGLRQLSKYLVDQHVTGNAHRCFGKEDVINGGEDTFVLYRLSSFWNVPMACVVTMFVGVVVSYLTGANDVTSVDRRLLSPVIRKFVRKSKSTPELISFNDYKPVELHIIPEDTDMDGRTEQLLVQHGT